MSEFKVGDKVRVKAGSKIESIRRGEEFVITSLDLSAITQRPYAHGDERGCGVYLEDLEHVIPTEVDRTEYPKFVAKELVVSRNFRPEFYGDEREAARDFERVVFFEGRESSKWGTLSITEARDLAKYLTDIADRIESDQAIRKQQAAQAKADKKAELKAKIKELKATLADLKRQVEEN
jgi:hypothetical protein